MTRVHPEPDVSTVEQRVNIGGQTRTVRYQVGAPRMCPVHDLPMSASKGTCAKCRKAKRKKR